MIRELWAEDRLPALRSLADQGTSATLGTAYGASPVIWTTVATGRRPQVHGITGFVVPTDRGDLPVSSRSRRVPAIWNVASAAGKRVAVLGWWATWPAERLDDGIVVSDRALRRIPGWLSPIEREDEVGRLVEAVQAEPSRFGGNPEAAKRDELMSRLALQLAADPPDLTLLYYRSVDIVSHHHWKQYRPEQFDHVPPDEIDRFGRLVPSAYEAVDDALGELLDAWSGPVNVVVLSDHGFRAANREEIRVVLDLDRVLEHLDLLSRGDGGLVDPTASRAMTHGAAPAENPKLVAVSGDLDTVVDRLEAVTWEGGQAAFEVRPAAPRERAGGAALSVRVIGEEASRAMRWGNATWSDAVQEIVSISGTHGRRTHGILVAAGPDIRPDAELEGITIHGVMPTLARLTGIPVSEELPGDVWTELFTEAFLERSAVITVPGYGPRTAGEAIESPIDDELRDELRSLGYID